MAASTAMVIAVYAASIGMSAWVMISAPIYRWTRAAWVVTCSVMIAALASDTRWLETAGHIMVGAQSGGVAIVALKISR